MNKTVKKLKQNNGFTLSELLIATLIVLLTSGMLITCIHLGLKQLYKQTAESEAQMLCTMLSTAVQDELTYATSVESNDTATGKVLSFSKEGNKVSFFIATETTDDNPENFAFEAVTDDADHAGTNLGKIYLRSFEETDPTKIVTHGLVSTGAYNINNSSDGSLQAGMQLIPLTGGYEVKIDVYNGTDVTKPLATKNFYVGKISADLSGRIGVDTGIETYTVVFNANGGAFADGTEEKRYSGLLEGDTVKVPADPTSNGRTFLGWSPEITGTTVTITGNATYTARWSGGNGTARFYRTAADIPGDHNITTISAVYGRKIGIKYEGQEIFWPVITDQIPEGYEFVGWRDQSGNAYYIAAGDTWTFTKDEKFVAIFEQKHTARFYRGYDTSGNPTDEITSARKSVAYKASMELPEKPTKAGYVFAGWEYQETANSKGLIDEKLTTRVYDWQTDMAFVAKWEKRVTFYAYTTKIAEAEVDANGEIISFKTGNIFDSFASMKEGIAHKDNPSTLWVFKGWYYHDNGTLEYDVYGSVQNAASIRSLLNANGNVDLYAGWTNNAPLYYRTDALPAANSGVYNNFLIVGEQYGNTPYQSGGNRALHITNSGKKTADVTVLGDNIEMYIKADGVTDYAWKTDDEGTKSGRVYIRKKKNNNDQYLDVKTTGGVDVRMSSTDNSRQWSYTNGRLKGEYWWWDRWVEMKVSDRYIDYYNDFYVYENVSGNGNVHIYAYQPADQLLSFNGYVK